MENNDMLNQKVMPMWLTPLLLTASLLLSTQVAFAAEKSKYEANQRLEYGTVLFELYKRDYFNALVNHAYASSEKNTLALNEQGQLLKGGMLLSYGVPSQSKRIFDNMIHRSETEKSRNAAWFYLAKLLYSKAETEQAKETIAKIAGDLPDDLHIEYHYLSTLVGTKGEHLNDSRKALEEIKQDLPEYPYYLFNFAIRTLNEGDIDAAAKHLTDVIDYAYLGDEYEVLADRAKHGLSQLASSRGQLLEAWQHLSDIRTTGLYSNRALLSYAWAAIKLKQYKEAIPALEILDTRSIALPEVQEGKVLLAHLYEQDGMARNALKQNIIAEKEYRRGLDMIESARAAIALQDVPREFISNLEHIVRETDWYGENPEVDYQNLTPFLIDLLAANNFNETLKELADLYAIEKNLRYWALQEEQHLTILKTSQLKSFNDRKKATINKASQLAEALTDKQLESRLLILSLPEADQKRFDTLLANTNKTLKNLQSRSARLENINTPYITPPSYANRIKTKQGQIQAKLKATHKLIARLENVVRRLVNLELDRHASRMSYYAAQAKLAKARLYDSTLLDLDRAKKRVKPTQNTSASKNNGATK